MFRIALLIALLIWSIHAIAGKGESSHVFLIGHSLVNHDMPVMLSALAADAGIDHTGGRQIINGANLQWQWNNSHTAEGMDARQELPTGQWDVLVMTEAVPLDNHLTWSDTYVYAGYFHDLALTANPQSQIFIYETWHCINSGLPEGCAYDDGDDVPWRDRLDQDLPKWQGIADYLNANSSGPEASLIPVGQALALLHDRIAVDEVPGLEHVFNLFSDDIHLTDSGNYFVALVLFATIYRVDPQGLTWEISDQWNTPFDLPEEGTATALQAIAWEAVQEYLDQPDLIFSSRFQ